MDSASPQSRQRDSPATSVAVALTPLSEDVAFGVVESPSWPLSPLPQIVPHRMPSPSKVKRRRTNDTDPSSFYAPQGHLSPSNPSQKRAVSFGENSAVPAGAVESAHYATSFSEQAHQQSLLGPCAHDEVREAGFGSAHSTPRAFPNGSIQEACLLRYFIDELACWVCFRPQFSPYCIPQAYHPSLISVIQNAILL